MDAVITETEDQNFDGGCHCAVILFRVKGPLRQILMCHCSDCLKLSGTSWGASAAMLDRLTYLGTARPRWYRSSSWPNAVSARIAGRRCSTHVTSVIRSVLRRGV